MFPPNVLAYAVNVRDVKKLSHLISEHTGNTKLATGISFLPIPHPVASLLMPFVKNGFH